MELDPPKAVHMSPMRMLLTSRQEKVQSLRMHEAILLIGPTGSGKTPLGDVLEAKGLRDMLCRHFDFGVHLRRVACGEQAGGPLARHEIEVVRSVLQTGRLLEDERFAIAGKLLEHFLAEHSGDNEILLVLNGLPRHVGQAREIDSMLQVRTFIWTARPKLFFNASGLMPAATATAEATTPQRPYVTDWPFSRPAPRR